MISDSLFSSAPAQLHLASQWLALLESEGCDPRLKELYGPDPAVLIKRRRHIIRALCAFLLRFDDRPVRIFRAPGRVNLRGMHVDTHGGFLNLMTHQREVVLVASQSQNGGTTIANSFASYGEAQWEMGSGKRIMPARNSWMEEVTRDGFAPARSDWGDYIQGAFIWLEHQFPGHSFSGVEGVVASDLPVGASLSSSTALNLVSLLAFSAMNNITLSDEQLIRASRSVEWYAGARSGVSDQTAILLGRRDHFLQVALHPEELNLFACRSVAFPDELVLLVINSCTTRTLSGAQRVRYSLNRFAYSMAMTVLQSSLRERGYEEDFVLSMDRLPRITPQALGGTEAFIDLLKSIPESISLEALRQRYAPPDLELHYGRYFEGVPEEEKPRDIPLRGPLIFGIAESMRAQRFGRAMREGMFSLAGDLMTIGHTGDRVRDNQGEAFHASVSNEALDESFATVHDFAFFPGSYGASSPALDWLVDRALEKGALGASLTGAGMAGVVMALCYRDGAEALRESLLERMASSEYIRLAGEHSLLTSIPEEEWVVVNQAVAGAGEILVPS
jgi:galactokinase